MTENKNPPEDAPAQPQPPVAGAEQSQGSPASNKVDTVSGKTVNVFQIGSLSFDALKALSRGVLEDFGDADLGPIARQVADRVHTAREDIAFGGDSRESNEPPPPPPEDMPSSDEALESWYQRLTDRERCFVRATAILHGAPVYHVTRAANELFAEVERRRPKASKSQRVSSPAESASTNRDMLPRTCTLVLEVGGVRRLYWRDVDTAGYSAFGLNALRLISYEIEGTAGLAGCDVQAWAETCARSGTRDVAWRAARALGVIWWRLERSNIKHKAREWAMRAAGSSQQGAAGLLFGAYEIERAETPEEQDKRPAPIVTSMLRELTLEARQSERMAGIARTLAATYNLISRRWPDSALAGLAEMLGLETTRATFDGDQMPIDVFIPATLGYVQIAWNGDVRLVLARLATYAERLAQPVDRQGRPSEVLAAQSKREEKLSAIFFTFFFLVASSLAGADRQQPHVYEDHRPLGSRPRIPDANGRDVLLAAILNDEETDLRVNIESMFCAAFVAGHAVAAGAVLRQWAQLITASTTESSRDIRLRYIQFAASVGRRLDRWDKDFDLKGARAGSALYANQLNQWPSHTEIGQLAVRITARLSANNSL